ncbi:hypothetical protein ACLOJK_038309 [Asimina triloba]
MDNSTDMEVLLSFKSHYITSDPSNALGGWNNTSPFCTWLGISCTNHQTPHVSSINLPHLSLTGTIPPLLSNLSSLQFLDLSNNLFHGKLPHHLFSLPLLRTLSLRDNSLTGALPHNLSSSLNLQHLFLASNRLSGNLPPFPPLPSLSALEISHNYLTGPIPPSIGNLSSLVHLYLSNNLLSGHIPQELGSLRDLTHLQISESQLAGAIPSSVYNLSSLEFFSITKNKLTGQLPQDIGLLLPNLNKLLMSENDLDGPIPPSLSNISGMQYLYLSTNRFHGSLPLLGNMHGLRHLGLEKNSLSSTTDLNRGFFDSLTNCTHLELFSLTANDLAGQLPASTANLSAHLQGFNVDDNHLSGPFPQGMHSYPNLTVLDLSRNSFTGGVPESVGLLPQLQMLLLSGNRFVGKIPDVFGNLTKLYQLNLSDNQFYGGIPQNIGVCGHLELLDLSNNNLTGIIPKTMFNPQSLTLRVINLARNFLTSSLPVEVGELKMLEFMDLSDNNLSGSIPAYLGDCSSLLNLRMARNQLEGSIPESFCQLKVLESLDLSSNALSGEIPGILGKLRFLSNLNPSFNHLQGKVPRDGVFTNISYESLQGNKGLCSDDKLAQTLLSLPQCSSSKKGSSTSLALKVAVPIACFAALLCSLSCLIHKANSIKPRRRKNMDRALSMASFKGTRMKLSYEDLVAATNNFNSNDLIGKGSFGSVYRGNIGGVGIAIKVLDQKQQKASARFASECKALRNIRHRNLVKIITACSSVDHKGAEFKALVMELMGNGSLDKWLHPVPATTPSSTPKLGLLQRLNISIDIAAAMDYLHHDCDPPIVHCDLKPKNVLLDNKMTARIGDFGLARFLSWDPLENQSTTVGFRGSIGYIPPECGLGSRLSTRADVYSYGILLLEMFTGKKPTDNLFKDGFNLNKFVSALLENQLAKIVDPSLLEEEDESERISNGISSSTNSTSSRRGSSSSSKDETSHETCKNMMHEVGADWQKDDDEDEDEEEEEACSLSFFTIAIEDMKQLQ